MSTPIKQIQTNDGVKHDVQAPEYIIGTQTESTPEWVGQTISDELYDGKMILYKLSYAGSAATNTHTNVTTTQTLELFSKDSGNSLGWYPVYRNNSTTFTTLYPSGTVLQLVFDASASNTINGSTKLGAWKISDSYVSDTDKIGYQLRGTTTKVLEGALGRYKIMFTSVDNKKWVVPTVSTTTGVNTAKAVTTTAIDPFGEIVYYPTTTILSGGTTTTTTLWQQYAPITISYSFNRNGKTPTMTTRNPVYVKATPQQTGGVVIDANTPYVQSLPSSEDGSVYIYLGEATSATNIELKMKHPTYYYKDGSLRLWTNAEDMSANASNITPIMDGTGAVGSSTTYARADHVHPTDTSRAPLASPSFTGTPTAPTATAGDTSGQIANTSFVNNAITTALANITGISFEVFASVSSLPSTGEAGKFYLVNKSGTTNDTYDEYIWYNGGYELIGSTQFTLSTDKASVITGYPGVTTSITPVSSTANAITSVALTDTTSVVTSYPGVTTSFYPAANVTAVTGITYGTTSVYGTGVATVLQSVSPNNSTFSITVSGDELIIGSTVAVSGVTLTSTTTSVANGTSTKVATSASVKTSTNVRGTSITVLSGLGTPDTAGVATSITYGSTAFAKAGTAITVMTGLGIPSTVQAVTNVVQQ